MTYLAIDASDLCITYDVPADSEAPSVVGGRRLIHSSEAITVALNRAEEDGWSIVSVVGNPTYMTLFLHKQSK